jgi:hypothetical protein
VIAGYKPALPFFNVRRSLTSALDTSAATT